jgi:CheY-like chemotaxis protein
MSLHQPSLKSAAPGAPDTEAKPKILVVEDDPVSRLLITHSLRQHGFDTVDAPHGAEAIRILQEDRSVDMLFTDVCLPGNIDGVGIVRWVFANRPDLPVMLGTGSALGRKTSMLVRPHRTFLKPYNVQDLVAHIRSLAPGAWVPRPPARPQPRQAR